MFGKSLTSVGTRRIVPAMTTTTDSSKSLTSGQVARMWGVSRQTVQRAADAGKLRYSLTPGGHRRFRPEDIRQTEATS